jgi:hypothetical protein
MAAAWTIELVSSASYTNTAPGLAVRGLGNAGAIINEFDVVLPTSSSSDASFLEQNWKDPTANPPITSWQNFAAGLVGPNVTSAPVALSSAANPGRIYVFAIDSSNSLIYWNWAAGLVKGATDGWVAGGALPGSVGMMANFPPAAVSWAPGRVDVFAISAAGILLHWWLIEPAPWNPADPVLGGFANPEQLDSSNLTGSPAAASWASGRLDVFACTTSSSLQHWWFDQSNGNNVHFGAFEYLGQANSPCAVSWGQSRLDVFANSPGNGIVHWWYDGSVQPVQSFNGSGQPATLGGSANCGPPAAVSWGPGRFDVFACSPQGQLLHWWQDWDNAIAPPPPGSAGLNAPDTLLAKLQQQLPSGNTIAYPTTPACASGGVGNLEVVALASATGSPYVVDHWTFGSFNNLTQGPRG